MVDPAEMSGVACALSEPSTPVRAMTVKRPLPDGTDQGTDMGDDQVDLNMLLPFVIEEKLNSEKYQDGVIKELSGSEFTVAHIQKDGFINPVLVKKSVGLGLQVPDVGVQEIKIYVGSRRYLDVMDVSTQKEEQMTMKEFKKYWDVPMEGRKKLLNVISLEFSKTKLDPLVIAPRLVRQIDWIDKVWPRHLKEMQSESTNSIDDMMYPKVQKYCLMSVKGCWTDFHIALGGTSVWYHILKGRKTFWLCPPSDDNLKKYQSWILSGKQSEVFFGDFANNCTRVQLDAGSTFFIPSGWIHAVYTQEDSIVFGGNFLHSFSIEKQLQIAHLEEVLKVSQKFRFPFFTEMLWYVLDRYVYCLFGHTHLDLPEEEKRRIKLEKGEKVDPNKVFLKLDNNTSHQKVSMTKEELSGLKYIVSYLYFLPTSKKNVPVILPDPIILIQDVKKLVTEHLDDDQSDAITGNCILRWNEIDDEDLEIEKKKKSQLKERNVLTPETPSDSQQEGSRGKPGRKPGNINTLPQRPRKSQGVGNRRRRVRCKKCDACLSENCEICTYCCDMTKYGGPGRLKQTCEKRRCLQPQLPISSSCSECQLDGWYTQPKLQMREADRPDEPPKLYECSSCFEIMHPDCAEMRDGLGRINIGMCNSWECAKCLGEQLPIVSQKNSLKDDEPQVKKSRVH